MCQQEGRLGGWASRSALPQTIRGEARKRRDSRVWTRMEPGGVLVLPVQLGDLRVYFLSRVFGSPRWRGLLPGPAPQEPAGVALGGRGPRSDPETAPAGVRQGGGDHLNPRVLEAIPWVHALGKYCWQLPWEPGWHGEGTRGLAIQRLSPRSGCHMPPDSTRGLRSPLVNRWVRTRTTPGWPEAVCGAGYRPGAVLPAAQVALVPSSACRIPRPALPSAPGTASRTAWRAAPPLMGTLGGVYCPFI